MYLKPCIENFQYREIVFEELIKKDFLVAADLLERTWHITNVHKVLLGYGSDTNSHNRRMT